MPATQEALLDRPPDPAAASPMEPGSNGHPSPLLAEEGFLDDQASGQYDMAPVVVIGGLLVPKCLQPLYDPLLRGASELPASERFLPVPDLGLGHHQGMYDRLEQQIASLHEKLQRPIVLAGHSLGALMATKFGADHPEMVSDVACLAGVQNGIKQETPSTRALAYALGHPPGKKLLRHDSDHMTAHRETIAKKWSPDVTLHLLGSLIDDLVVTPQGLNLELPEGQKPERRVVWLPFTSPAIRRIPGMPKDVEVLRSPLLCVDHYFFPLNPAVIRYVRQVRKAAVGNFEPIEVNFGARRSLQPVPAVA